MASTRRLASMSIMKMHYDGRESDGGEQEFVFVEKELGGGVVPYIQQDLHSTSAMSKAKPSG
jgi:hypothetical protein